MTYDTAFFYICIHMKVYSISKWTFGVICLLILLLPVSHHWRLLIKGYRAKGTVTRYTARMFEDIMGERKLEYSSEIIFEVDGVPHKAYGPRNYEYATGRRLTVFYLPEEPSRNVIATFSGFYLGNYTILPLILITVWYAFYLSFNRYRKRMKMPRGRTGKNSGFNENSLWNANRNRDPVGQRNPYLKRARPHHGSSGSKPE